jgi:putative MATE family efflux protein
MNQRKGRDLTGGSLHRAIWTLAPAMTIELVVLNIAQLLDAYWVGQLGSTALAAVTLSATVRWVLNSLANGLGVGGMAVVARHTGAGDEEGAARATGQTLLLGLGASLFVAALGLTVAEPLLRLLGADAQVLPLALAYLRVALGGVSALVLNFVINAMLRGTGDAQWSMRVLLLSTAATVGLEPALIWGLGPLPSLGVLGSAWAFVLGYGAGLVLQMVILLGNASRIRVRSRHLRPDLVVMKQIAGIALPSSLQMTLRSSSRLVILALVGLYGTFATAGYGVANRLLLIVFVPCFGLGNAAGTLVGQNLGAGQPDRGERTAWWVTTYATGYMTVMATIITILAPSLIALFDPTPEVVAHGATYLRIVAWSDVISAVGAVLERSFDGAGDTLPAMSINLLSLWVVEVALAWALSHALGWGATGVWWGRTLANLVNGILFVIWFRRGRWKAHRTQADHQAGLTVPQKGHQIRRRLLVRRGARQRDSVPGLDQTLGGGQEGLHVSARADGGNHNSHGSPP